MGTEGEEGGTKAMIIVDERQKDSLSFTVMGFSHIKSVFYPRVIHAPKQPFSAFNTDITPTTAGIRLLCQFVAYIIVHFCMYITLPHKLFRSCRCGAADLRQSKALLTSDPPYVSLSHTQIHTRTATHTCDLPAGLWCSADRQ